MACRCEEVQVRGVGRPSWFGKAAVFFVSASGPFVDFGVWLGESSHNFQPHPDIRFGRAPGGRLCKAGHGGM